MKNQNKMVLVSFLALSIIGVAAYAKLQFYSSEQGTVSAEHLDRIINQHFNKSTRVLHWKKLNSSTYNLDSKNTPDIFKKIFADANNYKDLLSQLESDSSNIVEQDLASAKQWALNYHNVPVEKINLEDLNRAIDIYNRSRPEYISQLNLNSRAELLKSFALLSKEVHNIQDSSMRSKLLYILSDISGPTPI